MRFSTEQYLKLEEIKKTRRIEVVCFFSEIKLKKETKRIVFINMMDRDFINKIRGVEVKSTIFIECSNMQDIDLQLKELHYDFIEKNIKHIVKFRDKIIHIGDTNEWDFREHNKWE